MTVPPDQDDDWLKSEPVEPDSLESGSSGARGDDEQEHGAEVIPIHDRRMRITPRSEAGQSFMRGDHAELGARLVQLLLARAGEGGDVVSAEDNVWSYSDTTGVYLMLEREALRGDVLRFAGLPVVLTKNKPLKVQAGDMKGVVEVAKVVAYRSKFFDHAMSGIAFSSSFVRVTADGIEQREHSKDHRARWAYPFGYIPGGAGPARWLRFLEEIWQGDADVEQKVALLQEYLGLCIIGQGTLMHTALFLVGLGANGKSVICEVIENCLPPGSVCSIPIQKMDQDYHKARLIGRLCNVMSELPENDIIATESWKGLVSGDLSSARAVFKEVTEFRPIAGHVYGLNNLPAVNDFTDGFWRRVAVLECNRTFAPHEQDKTLPAQLRTERNGIIAWALEGAVRALRMGRLTNPSSSDAAKRRWRNEADQVRPFMTEMTETVADGSYTVSAGDLYSAYKRWAQENGHKPMSSTKFGRRVKSILNMKADEAHTRTGTRYPVRVVYANGPARDDSGPWEYGR